MRTFTYSLAVVAIITSVITVAVLIGAPSNPNAGAIALLRLKSGAMVQLFRASSNGMAYTIRSDKPKYLEVISSTPSLQFYHRCVAHEPLVGPHQEIRTKIPVPNVSKQGNTYSAKFPSLSGPRYADCAVVEVSTDRGDKWHFAPLRQNLVATAVVASGASIALGGSDSTIKTGLAGDIIDIQFSNLYTNHKNIKLRVSYNLYDDRTQLIAKFDKAYQRNSGNYICSADEVSSRMCAFTSGTIGAGVELVGTEKGLLVFQITRLGKKLTSGRNAGKREKLYQSPKLALRYSIEASTASHSSSPASSSSSSASVSPSPAPTNIPENCDFECSLKQDGTFVWTSKTGSCSPITCGNNETCGFSEGGNPVCDEFPGISETVTLSASQNLHCNSESMQSSYNGRVHETFRKKVTADGEIASSTHTEDVTSSRIVGSERTQRVFTVSDTRTDTSTATSISGMQNYYLNNLLTSTLASCQANSTSRETYTRNQNGCGDSGCPAAPMYGGDLLASIRAHAQDAGTYQTATACRDGKESITFESGSYRRSRSASAGIQSDLSMNAVACPTFSCFEPEGEETGFFVRSFSVASDCQ